MDLEKALQIVIRAKDMASSVFRQVSHSVNNFAERASRSLLSLKSLLLGGVGIYGLIRAGTALIQSAGQQEQAVAGLHTALLSMERYTPELEKALLDTASAMQRVTTFGDEATIQGMKFLVTYKGISDELLIRSTKAMLDIAALKGSGGVVEAANMLGKASMGMTGELKRVGITVDANTFKMKGYVGVLKQIEDQVKGQAEAMRKTGVGAFQALGNAVSDVSEELGFVLLEGITGSVNKFSNLVLDVVDRIKAIRETPEFEAWATRVQKALSIGKVSVKEITDAFIKFIMDGILKVAEALRDLIRWIRKNQAEIKGLGTALLEAGKAAGGFVLHHAKLTVSVVALMIALPKLIGLVHGLNVAFGLLAANPIVVGVGIMAGAFLLLRNKIKDTFDAMEKLREAKAIEFEAKMAPGIDFEANRRLIESNIISMQKWGDSVEVVVKTKNPMGQVTESAMLAGQAIKILTEYLKSTDAPMIIMVSRADALAAAQIKVADTTKKVTDAFAEEKQLLTEHLQLFREEQAAKQQGPVAEIAYWKKRLAAIKGWSEKELEERRKLGEQIIALEVSLPIRVEAPSEAVREQDRIMREWEKIMKARQEEAQIEEFWPTAGRGAMTFGDLLKPPPGLPSMWEQALSGIRSAIERFWEDMGGVFGGVERAASQSLTAIHDAFSDMISKSIVRGTKFKNVLENIWGDMQTRFRRILGDMLADWIMMLGRKLAEFIAKKAWELIVHTNTERAKTAVTLRESLKRRGILATEGDGDGDGDGEKKGFWGRLWGTIKEVLSVVSVLRDIYRWFKPKKEELTYGDLLYGTAKGGAEPSAKPAGRFGGIARFGAGIGIAYAGREAGAPELGTFWGTLVGGGNPLLAVGMVFSTALYDWYTTQVGGDIQALIDLARAQGRSVQEMVGGLIRQGRVMQEIMGLQTPRAERPGEAAITPPRITAPPTTPIPPAHLQAPPIVLRAERMGKVAGGGEEQSATKVEHHYHFDIKAWDGKAVKRTVEEDIIPRLMEISGKGEKVIFEQGIQVGGA